MNKVEVSFESRYSAVEFFLSFQLQDTKSNDRAVTFLHYLAEIIDAKLPHIRDFCDEFDLERSTKGKNKNMFNHK